MNFKMISVSCLLDCILCVNLSKKIIKNFIGILPLDLLKTNYNIKGSKLLKVHN